MKRYRSYLFLAIALGFIVRIVIVFLTKSHIHPELFEYEGVIENLLSGKGFVYYNDKFRLDYYAAIHPLFTFICAGIYKFTNHSFLIVELFQIVVSLFSGYFIYRIGEKLFNEPVAVVAAVLTIFHPGSIIYSTTKIGSMVLDTFFFVLVIFLIKKAKDTLKRKDFILLGTVIGLGALARGTIIIFLPIAAIYYLLVLPLSKQEVLKNIGLTVVMAILLLSPWWIRNYQVLKHPVYMTTESMGYMLWVGFNENATGTLYTLSGRPQWEEAPSKLKEMVWSQRDEMAQQDILRNEAMSFITKNPVQSLVLYVKRMFYFWWFTPTQGLLYPWYYLIIYRLLYATYLLFAIISLCFILCHSGVDRSAVALVVAVLAGLCLLQGFYYVEGRHRWEIEPLLLLFTAHGLNLTFRRRKDEDSR